MIALLTGFIALHAQQRIIVDQTGKGDFKTIQAADQ